MLSLVDIVRFCPKIISAIILQKIVGKIVPKWHAIYVEWVFVESGEICNACLVLRGFLASFCVKSPAWCKIFIFVFEPNLDKILTRKSVANLCAKSCQIGLKLSTLNGKTIGTR